MKKFMNILLAILIVAFLLSGCEEGGSDNNSGNGSGTGTADSGNSLTGVWHLQIVDGMDISSLTEYTKYIADFDSDGSDETVIAEPIFLFTPTTVKRYYKITAVNSDPGTSTVAVDGIYTESSSGADYYRNGCAFYTDSNTNAGMTVFVVAGNKMYWNNLNTQHNYELERLNDSAVAAAISY